MQLVNILLTILIMSLFCQGMSILFWEEMIFEGLGKWYNNSYSVIEQWNNYQKSISNRRYAGFETKEEEAPIKPSLYNYFIKNGLKPVIGCVICYSSFWGTIIFFSLKYIQNSPISFHTLPEWIISCTSCAYLNYKLNQ